MAILMWRKRDTYEKERGEERHTTVSSMIMGAALAATAILVLGMLLTLAHADPGEALVARTLETARWLATPFQNVFDGPDAQRHVYLDWGLSAAVYYLGGRALAMITPF